MTLSFLAGEFLEPTHDHVAVQRVDLHQEGPSPGLLGGDQRAAGSAEEIEDVLARSAAVLNRADGQLHGLLGQVHHIRRGHFLDAPEIGLVVRPEELVGSPFTPTVKRQLKGAHEVLPSQNRPTFVPDDGLAEVQPALP